MSIEKFQKNNFKTTLKNSGKTYLFSHEEEALKILGSLSLNAAKIINRKHSALQLLKISQHCTKFTTIAII